jgi:NAD(P)-dependent dehydrogenase (short-subunit alcohol dehydrogenase family)
MSDREWVLVTGGGRGIGETIALKLAERGTNVVVAALEQDEAEHTASRAERLGVAAHAIRYDARSEGSIVELFTSIRERGVKLDRVVCNAGVYSGLKLLCNLSASEFDEVMNVNARGTFLCCREAIRHFSGRPGSIVNVSSSLGKKSLPAMGAYCASKAAINSLTRTLALEYAPLVRVNAVCPGPVETTMTQRGFPQVAAALGVDMPTLQQKLMEGFPLKRIASAEDVADVVLFLLSDAARNLTGQCVNTDAGWLMEA